MGEIIKLSELDETQVNQAFDVFVEGFYNVMSSISKDKKVLHKLFKDSFDYDMAYAYVQDGVAVGFLGVATHIKRAVNFNRDAFIEILGGFAGKMVYRGVSSSMMKPNAKGPHEIYIDFIATSPEHRSMGIGSKLIGFVRDELGYKNIELEVFSKNPKAIKFYEREGFKAVEKKRDLLMRMQGFGYRIIMRWEAESK